MSTSLFEITNGPSREELFDSLRLMWENRWVEFTVVNTLTGVPHRIKGVVRGIVNATEYQGEECWWVKLASSSAVDDRGIVGLQYYPTIRKGSELPPNILVRFANI